MTSIEELDLCCLSLCDLGVTSVIFLLKVLPKMMNVLSRQNHEECVLPAEGSKTIGPLIVM